MASAAPLRRPVDRMFELVVILLGFRLGARPIADNSMFVHLRTGIDIAAGKGIPRMDPYSFTAAGEPWVVQSWFPSALYGLARDVGGDGLLLVLQGVLTAALAVLVLRLVAPAGSGLRAAGLALVALSIGGPFWAARPLLVGMLCLGLTILVVREERAPWLLVPVTWLWVSSHGSFPLGALWLGLTAAGALAERRTVRVPEVKALAWFGAGLLVACMNPLGPRLLLFPFVIGDRAQAFQAITEWRSPDFQQPLGRVALVGLVLFVGLLARRRVAWTVLLPTLAFLGMALLALRNLAPLSLVAAAALGEAHRRDRAAESEPGEGWRRADRVVLALLAAVVLVVGADAARRPALDLASYPTEVVVAGEEMGVLAPGRRVAAQDVVGCFLILRRGRGAGVFVDDRFDMYPLTVFRDYRTLLRAEPGALDVLARRGIDTVLWDRRLPLVALLRADGWNEPLGDDRWAVLTRPGTWPP